MGNDLLVLQSTYENGELAQMPAANVVPFLTAASAVLAPGARRSHRVSTERADDDDEGPPPAATTIKPAERVGR